MSRVQLAVFPAILVGIIMIVVVTSLIGKPQLVMAANEPARNQEGSTGNPSAGNPEALADPVAPGSGGSGGGGNFIGENTPVPYVEPVFNENPDSESSSGHSQVPDGCSLSDRYASSVLQWCDLIEKYAADNGLEAALVAALITQESGGNQQAYSHSGAVGLMQVMPSDGLAASFMCASGPCFSDRPTSDELFDPEYNISYGTKMLSGLVAKYGNIRDALLYYGPINVGYYYADKVLAIYNSHQS